MKVTPIDEKKNAKLILTKRDIEIVSRINHFGFVLASDISRLYQVENVTIYKRLRKLLDAGYLNHSRVFYRQHGIYFATQKGVDLCGDLIPPIKQIPIATYDHDLMVVRIASTLMRHHPDAEFKTERMLRHDRGGYAVGNRGHLSDGEWWTDDRPIAIEVELSQKGSRRRERIFSHYRRETQYKEVWYFCGTEKLASQVSAYRDRFSFLRVFEIDKWFAQYDAAAEILKANEPAIEEGSDVEA